MKTNTCLNFLLALGGLLFSLHTQATCTVTNSYTGFATLRGVNYSAGAEFPAGGTIFRQLVNGFRSVSYSCNNGNAKTTLSIVGGTPLGGTTDTYESGIVGVGMKLTALNGSPLPVTVSSESASGTATTSDLGFYAIAVKIGPVTAGRANGALIPSLQWTVSDDSGVPVVLSLTNWNSGGFILTNPSCKTPDYTYDLGAVTITDSTITSNWVSTPVTLTGCGTFYGNVADNASYQNSIATNVAGTFGNFAEVGARARNIVSMTLTPQYTAIDPSTGVLANNPDGGIYARGVGVQIATVAGTTYTPLNLANPVIIRPALGGSANITFPLAARIIKTADVVNPGKVVTAATYTITYQ
ncbi:fimbrial protein [Enterobacter asburiae]|uniref:fimbrial protein n=1 Tax=Enterobacter asburiae TaxID=61645 RepID=UPI003F41EBE8